MEESKNQEDTPRRSYVLERMKAIVRSGERTVKWLICLWLASIVITLLGVAWFFFQ